MLLIFPARRTKSYQSHTPELNQVLTRKAGYHAKALDEIGSSILLKNYDDFYYGKGSSYPDINGWDFV
jgi:hypothetical protein